MTDTTKQPISHAITHTEDSSVICGNTNQTKATHRPQKSTEVLAKPERRTFSAEYKQQILNEADACCTPGCIGQLLRREGLYSSHLSKWRAEREQAIRVGLSKPRGRQRQEKNPLADENARLQREVQHLKTRLAQAETIIDVQKKLSQLLGLTEIPSEAGRSS
jgi:transposase-like protein